MHFLNMCAVLLFLYNSIGCFRNVSSTLVSCGPKDICECPTSIEMNCTKRAVQLNDVCGYINTTTHFNVTVLHADSLKTEIEVLRQDDLQGCQDLVELYLSGNGMRKIDTDAFREFQRLEILDLSTNNINVYNANSGDKIVLPGSLKELKLIGNYNMSMYDNLSYPDLSGLEALQSLFIDGLPFIDFNISYRSLYNLRSVKMSGLYGKCNISSVTNTTFINLPNVRYLNISACNITCIEAFSFGALSHLESLDLSWNMRLGFQALKNISYGLQFTAIQVLNISAVYTTFGPGQRVQIEDICYLANTTLKEIDFSRNRLQFVETNALALFPDTLDTLRVEYNDFTFRPYLLQLGCLKNVKEIYGSFQNFANSPLLFDTEFQGLNDRHYDTPGTSCPFINEAVVKNDATCPFIKPGKQIHIFPKYAPHFPPKLRRLEFIESNLIFAIVDMHLIEPSEHFEYLDVSGNVLYNWTGPFRSFTNLKHIDISKNYISYVHRHMLYFARKSLENLQIQNNYIGLVFKDENNGPFIFNNLTELKTLNLSYNFISHIPPNLLLASTKVNTLDLSVNNIEKWTLNVDQSDHLLHLNLRYNSFQTLPEELLNRLEANARRQGEQFTIDLRNNTMQVNCERKTFLQWLVKHQINMVGFKEYTFKNEEGGSISLDEFERDVSNLDEHCRSYTLIIVVSVVCSVAVLFTVAGGLIYKYRWKLRYVLRYAKIKRFGYQPIHDDTDRQYRFDVFVSYANENRDFIENKLYPNLTQKCFKVCLHVKDFLPGNNIADNILDAIGNSRYTLVILSNDYLNSTWCMYEFNMARMESIYERNGLSCLLLVMFEDVPTTKMPNEMLKWLDRNTYLEYTTDEQGELLFWENIERAVTAEI